MPLEGLSRLLSWFVPLVLLAVIILPQALRILREDEHGVIFRLGELLTVKGPGLIFSHSDRRSNVRMDLRVVTITPRGNFRLRKKWCRPPR
jgi:regulator of protease activity HflC (stomatin/prohibitin superfamily)